MIKILVFGMTENPGGVESFLMNYYRAMDREAFHMDFLCNTYDKIAYEDEILSMGGQTIHFCPRSRNLFRFYKETDAFFRDHTNEYDVIWVNVSSLANIEYLKLAKKYGISKRIIHSHNSQNMDTSLRNFLHKINRHSIQRYATDFWACSDSAAQWFYRDELLPKTVIIRNAINIERMAFSEESRKKTRGELGWQDQWIIGNIGRLHFQKNQMFLLDIFAELLKRCGDARLVLIGQGEDREKLEQHVKELNLSEQVFFAGVQYNVRDWLSAFDLYLFPSLFEGLSVVALEAQANGIPVLASAEAMPEEIVLNANFQTFSLTKTAAEWAEQLCRMRECSCRMEPEKIRENFCANGFEIHSAVKRAEELLSNTANNS